MKLLKWELIETADRVARELTPLAKDVTIALGRIPLPDHPEEVETVRTPPFAAYFGPPSAPKTFVYEVDVNVKLSLK